MGEASDSITQEQFNTAVQNLRAVYENQRSELSLSTRALMRWTLDVVTDEVQKTLYDVEIAESEYIRTSNYKVINHIPDEHYKFEKRTYHIEQVTELTATRNHHKTSATIWDKTVGPLLAIGSLADLMMNQNLNMVWYTSVATAAYWTVNFAAIKMTLPWLREMLHRGVLLKYDLKEARKPSRMPVDGWFRDLVRRTPKQVFSMSQDDFISNDGCTSTLGFFKSYFN